MSTFKSDVCLFILSLAGWWHMDTHGSYTLCWHNEFQTDSGVNCSTDVHAGNSMAWFFKVEQLQASLKSQNCRGKGFKAQSLEQWFSRLVNHIPLYGRQIKVSQPGETVPACCQMYLTMTWLQCVFEPWVVLKSQVMQMSVNTKVQSTHSQDLIRIIKVCVPLHCIKRNILAFSKFFKAKAKHEFLFWPSADLEGCSSIEAN